MKHAALLASLALGVVAVTGALVFVGSEVASAKRSLLDPKAAAAAESEKQKIEVADNAEVGYCTPQFKKVLERVLHACGLTGSEESRRGCQPTDVKSFASISDDDFNALFDPLIERGAIVMFDYASDTLSEPAKKLIEEKWDERHGARYFFIVARASKKGSVETNRALSHRRANSVRFHIESQTGDKELDKKVGTLWLGNEYAQLKKEYCTKWSISGSRDKCNEEAINQSAFISWVDCRL